MNGKICPICDNDFYPRPDQVAKGYGNYCSKQCWADTLKKRSSFLCVVCNKEFERVPWQVRKGYTKYCSRRCTDFSKRKFSTHGGGRDNLFTNWQKREWLDSHCLVCGSTDDLQLDHVVPRFAGGICIKSNAQTLCRKCNRDKYYHQDRPYYWWLASRDIFNRTCINSL